MKTAESNQIASCKADAKSVETALEAYRAQNHESYPPLLAPWSAASYETNYSSLTTATSNGGPWLRVAPATSNYVIEFDSKGDVWVAGFATFDSAYNSAQNFDLNPNACNVAVP